MQATSRSETMATFWCYGHDDHHLSDLTLIEIHELCSPVTVELPTPHSAVFERIKLCFGLSEFLHPDLLAVLHHCTKGR